MAVRIVGSPDDDREMERARRVRLEPLDTELDSLDDAISQRLGVLDQVTELLLVEPRDTDRRDGARPGEERRAEDDRQVAEVVALVAAQREAAHAVGIHLQEVERPRQEDIESGSLALAHQPLAGVDAHVRGMRRGAVQRGVGYALEHL